MTPEAKRELSTTIRAVRARLLDDLHAATESAYRLSVRTRDAELPEAAEAKRRRLEAWIEEQVRAQTGSKQRRTADDFRREVEKQAAYTLLNRLVILRLIEFAEPRRPAVATGGLWESMGYKNLREIAPALVHGDESEGYAFLLQLVFEDLATDLPGLYGPVGVADLVPIPTATLRYVIEALDAKDLETCWTDDMTLGWVYQYWNDPEREALDAKLNAGGKVEPHEIASKTQMFTERYMVDWLLQNSLGPMWLAMCRKHGWTPEVHADGTLARLEERRADWRKKREERQAALAAETATQQHDPSYEFDQDKLPGVSLTKLMPLHTDAERRWAYYVPQPIPEDAFEHAPESVRDLKILDPAVGSGHFLVVAFDLLVALYREEARHLGFVVPPSGGSAPAEAGTTNDWTDRAIVERILEHNLHGIDLDPRAVQIAAAALWLKAQSVCREARPSQLNLVASNLRLASLPDDDLALVELRREVERETGIPPDLTDTIVHALKGADHLGSLLKVDAAVEEAIRQHEAANGKSGDLTQKLLSDEFAPAQKEFRFDRDEARRGVVDQLESFLAKHTAGDDLGLRLRGEQLAAGVRFVRMVREGTYSLVAANPPYQSAQRLTDDSYLRKAYIHGKADLYAAFIMRAMEFAAPTGWVALVTMRSWMFIQQYANLRQHLLDRSTIHGIGDVNRNAFEEIGGAIVAAAMIVLDMGRSKELPSWAVRPVSLQDRGEGDAVARKRAGLMCEAELFGFSVSALQQIEGVPLVYWWSAEFIDEFVAAPKLGENSPVRVGLATSNNVRFLRFAWEVPRTSLAAHREEDRCLGPPVAEWVPYVKGGGSQQWYEPLEIALRWQHAGIENKVYNEHEYGSHTRQVRNEAYYFCPGVAFSATGTKLRARLHRYLSVFDVKGQSVFPEARHYVACLMNSTRGRYVLESLNPTISFQASDATRLPLFPIDGTESIFGTLDAAFSEHESHREPSVEFSLPGRSPWSHTQDWAQVAVDRAEGEPLPPYEPEYDTEPPSDHLSFALGVALGRFSSNGEGILDPAKSDISHALPAGILFLNGTLDVTDHRDGLGHESAIPLLAAWTQHSAAIAPGVNLRDYLRTRFFEDVHRKMYKNRPIHWPLSSEKKTFVVWVTIHRWTESTLRVLLADHLKPTLTRLEGELNDLRTARDGADKRAAREAEKRFPKVQKWREELAEFIKAVEQCAEKGPPPVDAKCPPREVDARYAADLDDGVMINSAALWPLLTPQWKDPKKWWKELATAQGKKDYDWAHLAMRFWPTRVDKKCQEDPSLGVAHGCFWRYHPARAWAWELRLQDEIGPDFRIDEASYRGDGGDVEHRAAYLRDHADEALETIAKEVLRRRRKQKTAQAELRILESGFWSRMPDECWDLEIRVMEKQSEDFHLLAPDEPEARRAYEQAHPDKVGRRERLLAELRDQRPLFEDEETQEDGEEDEETQSVAEEDGMV